MVSWKSSEVSVLRRTEWSTVPNVTDGWYKSAWEFTTKFNQEESISDLTKSSFGNNEDKIQNRAALRKTGRAIAAPVTLFHPTAPTNLALPCPHRYSRVHNPGNPTCGRETCHPGVPGGDASNDSSSCSIRAPVTPEERSRDDKGTGDTSGRGDRE